MVIIQDVEKENHGLLTVKVKFPSSTKGQHLCSRCSTSVCPADVSAAPHSVDPQQCDAAAGHHVTVPTDATPPPAAAAAGFYTKHILLT